MTKTMSTNSYQEGYKTGKGWNDSYRPGGPLHYYPRSYDKPEQQAKDYQTVTDWEDWHRGFDDAMSERGITKFLRG
jgi:hypothetical protein